MARGGARKGAGKPKGATTIRSQEVVYQYLNDGKKLPIDVLIGAMRKAWDEEETELAAAYAKDAAPYFHPKLANIEMTGLDGGPMEVQHSVGENDKEILERFLASETTKK